VHHLAVTELVSCGLTLPSKGFLHDEICYRWATPRRNKMPRHNQCVCVGTVTVPKKKSCGTSTWVQVMTSLYGVSRSRSLDTLHLVQLPWTSDQPHTETYNWQHTTLTTNRQPCLRGNSNSQSTDPCLKPRGHRDRHIKDFTKVLLSHKTI
jgi:hypothetical protein